MLHARSMYLFVVLLIGSILVSPVMAYDSYKTLADQNPTCGACNCDQVIKIDGSGLHAGKYEIGTAGMSITISNLKTKGNGDVIGFTWSSDVPIGCVIVKAGNGAVMYTYTQAATSDSNILWAYNHFGTPSKDYAISHIQFCSKTVGVAVPEFPIVAIPCLFIIGFGILLIHYGRKKE